MPRISFRSLELPAKQTILPDYGQLLPRRTDVIVRLALSDQEARLSLDQLARLHPTPPG
jgi:hypothetical protein